MFGGFFRFLLALAWLAVAAAGVYMFVDLMFFTDVPPGGEPRTVFDKAFPVIFLMLVPFGLWMARREYRQPDVPVDAAQAEQARDQRVRQRIEAEPLPKRYPLDSRQRDAITDTLNTLQKAGVLVPGEVDRAEFFDLAERFGVEEGRLPEVASLLGDYQIEHGIRYANLAVFYNQVEVFDDDIAAMAGAFARLAGRSGDMTELRVETLAEKPRARLHYRLDGAPGHLDFDYHVKYVSGTLMSALRGLFDPDPPFVLAFFDNVFLLSRLNDADMAAFNAEMEEDWEKFEPLV